LNQHYKAREFEDCERLLVVLAQMPDTQSVSTPDRQKIYFAIAAWYWKAQVDALREDLEDLEEENAELKAWKAGYSDAVEMAIEARLAGLGASGMPDPTVREVLQALGKEVEEFFAWEYVEADD